MIFFYFSVIEPKDRIGAKDKTYYTSIRGHDFFQGLDFEKLHQSIPTYLETFVKDGDAPGNFKFQSKVLRALLDLSLQ